MWKFSATVVLVLVACSVGALLTGISAEADAEPELDAAAVERGRAVHEAMCADCHSTDGTSKVALTFKNVWGTEVEQQDGSKRLYNRAFFNESIVDPAATLTKDYPNQMPPFILSQRQLYDLTEFVRSLGDPALVVAADKGDEKVPMAGAPGAVQVFVVCNEVGFNEMPNFYSNVLGLSYMLVDYEDEERLWVFLLEGVELTMVKAESPVKVPTGWAWTPDHAAEGEHGLSLAVDLPWQRFQQVVPVLQIFETRARTETPIWRASGRWAWTVADPMGNTVTLTAVPPQPPEDPKWPE